MPKMDKATLMVGMPKGSDANGGRIIKFEHSTSETQLAKDIADGLRAQGYKCKVLIDKDIQEEY